MKKISLLLFAFFIFSIKVNAQCTSEELNSLMKEVGQVTINYTYNEKANTFKIIAEGLSSNINGYVKNEGVINWDGNKETSISNLLPGKTYILEFISGESSSCYHKTLTSKSITLPFFNQYYKDELCVNHESYDLCKKFVYYKVNSYEEFKLRLNSYIKGLKKEEIPIENLKEEIKKDLFTEILKFLEKYYLFITIPIIVGGLTTITIIKIKERKESVL
jgi:hypothetical protein